MKGIINLHKKQPVGYLNDTNIPRKLDLTFNRDGRKWRVTAFTDTFVIGTAVDAKIDSHGEPVRASDIIKVML